MSKAIFIHGLYRSGSTYFFNKLRENDQCWCYYEPFHHILGRLKEDNIDIWKNSDTRTDKMSHPSLSRPHFFEYTKTFSNGKVMYFDKQLSYDRTFETDSLNLEKKYIDHLITSAPTGLIPVLQFNRTSFRLPGLVDYYSDCPHFYLLRNPHDQFNSYATAGPVFLAINLMLYSRLGSQCPDLGIVVNRFEHVSPDRELSNYIAKVPLYSLKTHYTIFFYFWLRSLQSAIQNGCQVVDVNSPPSIEAFTHRLSGLMAPLEDYNMRELSRGILTRREIETSEVKVFSCSLNRDTLVEIGYSIKTKPRFIFYERLKFYKQMAWYVIKRLSIQSRVKLRNKYNRINKNNNTNRLIKVGLRRTKRLILKIWGVTK